MVCMTLLLIAWLAMPLTLPVNDPSVFETHKSATDCVANVPNPVRQAGDTIASATAIASLPYVDTGTTTGFHDDYVPSCVYGGAPDVVYRLVAPTGIEAVTISLCGSSYDTSLYVYDSGLNEIACNDDWCESGSTLEAVPVVAGAIYYVVVDGYGSAHGAYTLNVDVYPPCTFTRPDWAADEGEPPLVDDYVDQCNSGCSAPQFGFPMTRMHFYDYNDRCGLWANCGWYRRNGEIVRDFDFLAFAFDVWPRPVRLVFVSEVACYIERYTSEDCDEYPGEWIQLAACEPETLVLNPGYYSDPFWFVVVAANYAAPGGGTGEFHYTVQAIDFYHFPGQPVPPSADDSFGCPSLPPGQSAWSADAFTFSNQFEETALGCYGSATPGSDAVFEVYLPAGRGCRIDINHPWYPVRAEAGDRTRRPIYLVDDCRDAPGSCVAVAETWDHFVSLTYTATVSGYYYLIYDQIDVSGGLHFHAWMPTDTTLPEPPAHDDCAGAVLLPAGPFAIQDDLSAARNRFDPGRDGCSGLGGTGRDVVYRVPMTTGQTLDVVMQGQGVWDEELYLIADCGDPQHSCLSGCERDGSGVHLTYTADHAAELWLICDSYGVGERTFTLTGTLDSATAVPLPELPLRLGPCRPNPFNPRTTIEFALPAAQVVTLVIHDMGGRRISLLHDGMLSAGSHAIAWDGEDDAGRPVAAGVYAARMKTKDGEVRVAKLVLVR